MPEQEMFIMGDPELVRLFGLLGIEGKEVEKPEDFIKVFNELIKQKSIGMIIIAMELSPNDIDFLLDFKINNRSPFVFHVPNIFEPNIDSADIFYNKIYDIIHKIII